MAPAVSRSGLMRDAVSNCHLQHFLCKVMGADAEPGAVAIGYYQTPPCLECLIVECSPSTPSRSRFCKRKPNYPST